ncbi:MAG: hypothetical protein U5L00_03585 [Desulfovermiculus sp.]|nr:hypothetical protein [Desulfovermiculus sp.]
MMKRVYVFLCFLGILFFSNNVMAAQIFFDDFESSDLSSTNSDGFSWGNPNRTSLVTMDPDADQGTCDGSETGAYAIWNNGDICNFGGEEKDWTAKKGDISMRFRYPAGESWAEQRFNMGGSYPELWIAYWIRIPTNYIHGTGGGGSVNQKFAAFWTVSYNDSVDPSCVLNFWPNNANDGGSRSTVVINNGGHQQSYDDFIEYPEDQGRWMHVVVRMKLSSSQGAQNGRLEWWRRWEGENSYTKLADITNIDWDVPSDSPGWSAGYLMGWANGSYDENTEFLLDDFTMSTTDLRQGKDIVINPPSNLEIDSN